VFTQGSVYVRLRLPRPLWERVKELAERELRRPAYKVVKLLERALEELEQKGARRKRGEQHVQGE